MTEKILGFFMVIGMLTYIFGRWRLVRDSTSDLGFIWSLALRYVPFAELMYLVRYYNQAQRGGYFCIAGMCLCVPYLGDLIWKQEKQFEKETEQVEKELAHREDNSSASSDDEEEDSEDDEEEGGDFSEWSAERYKQKHIKVTGLQARLNIWYNVLQQKRAALTSDPATTQAYKDEAAAYSAFNAITQEEIAELHALYKKTTPK